MFIPKEHIPAKDFERLTFGGVVSIKMERHGNKINGENLVVTRLGLISVDELKPHPLSNSNSQSKPFKTYQRGDIFNDNMFKY